jgi:hypothetical protein
MDPTVFILVHEAIPDSFLGFNLYTLITFFLKGVLLCGILRKLLPENPMFAVSVGMLFIIFPADDGLFTFRGMNIHTAVCLYLFAVYMLLSFYEKPHVLKLVAIWLSLLACVFMYELAHPLIAFTPLLLLWKERRLNRKIVRVAVAWWLGPLAAFLYAAYMFTHYDTYQSWVLARSGLNRPEVLREIVDSVWMAYRRHFVDGWTMAFGQIGLSAPLLLFALAAGALATATTAAQGYAMRGTTPAGNRRYVELILIGLVIIFLSYIVYMVTPYRGLTYRMCYFTGIGGAISIGSLAYVISRTVVRWRTVFLVIMGALLGLASVRAFNQHQYYVGLSVLQQQLLRGVARAVPKLAPSATLVIVDETSRYRNNWTLGAGFLVEDALRYVYDDYSLNTIFCTFDPAAGEFATLPEVQEQCQFASDEIRLYEAGNLVERVGYSSAVVVKFTDEGAVLLPSIPSDYSGHAGTQAYDPARLVDLSAAPPYRYDRLFSITD